MTDDQTPPQASKKKFAMTWLIAIGIVVAAPVLFCGATILLIETGYIHLFPHTDVSHSDFKTNTDRLNAVNSVLPITLPTSTVVMRFHLTGSIDLHMDFEGRIPLADIEPFVASLPPLDQPTPDTYKGMVNHTSLELTIERSTGEVQLVWFQM